jgi:hypothetical protein
MSRYEEATGQRLILLNADELPQAHEAASLIEDSGGQVLHMYGPRVMIGRVPEIIDKAAPPQLALHEMAAAMPADMVAEPVSEAEQLGLDAWNMRQSAEFKEAKEARARDGETWDQGDNLEPPDGPGMQHTGESGVLGAPELAFQDMSPYLIGSVAVGIILVDGPTSALQFTAAEKTKVVAEVQEGLTWLGTVEPKASVTWAYDIQSVQVNVAPNPALTGYEPLESLWRDPALGQLGFSQNFQGVRDYVASIRTKLGTRWGYVAFFTKYPVHHFAYASKPRLVMHYDNDGWGPDNIDRVFTHETGHIFGCPDEYGSSGCNCSAKYGFLQDLNGNCQNCASTFEPCLMAANTWAMCPFTRTHLGWRDSDGDGALDPVDPLSNPVIDWSQLCRQFPALCELLGLHALGVGTSQESAHESIPLFMLRRILTNAEMARVEAARAKEQEQYLNALLRKLEALTQEVKVVAWSHSLGGERIRGGNGG